MRAQLPTCNLTNSPSLSDCLRTRLNLHRGLVDEGSSRARLDDADVVLVVQVMGLADPVLALPLGIHRSLVGIQVRRVDVALQHVVLWVPDGPRRVAVLQVALAQRRIRLLHLRVQVRRHRQPLLRRVR
eukprot:122759-Rhodomonas_salina.1